MEPTEIAANILTDWFNELQTKIIAHLDKPNEKGHSLASRSLLRQEISAGGTIEQLGETTIALQLLLPDYWVYVDSGVKGIESTYSSSSQSLYKYKTKFPSSNMVASLEKYITTVGIKARKSRSETKERVFDTRKRIAYAIGVNVKKKGIAARKFITDVVNDQEINILIEQLQNALGDNFSVSITEGI